MCAVPMNESLNIIMQKLTKLDTIESVVSTSKQDLNELKKSVEFMSAQYDDLMKELVQYKKMAENNAKEIGRLDNQNQFLHREVKKLNIMLHAC